MDLRQGRRKIYVQNVWKNVKEACQSTTKFEAKSIQESIADYFNNTEYYDDEGLGGQYNFIPKVAMKMYVTDKECSVDGAVSAVITHLYGNLHSDIGLSSASKSCPPIVNCLQFLTLESIFILY